MTTGERMRDKTVCESHHFVITPKMTTGRRE